MNRLLVCCLMAAQLLWAGVSFAATLTETAKFLHNDPQGGDQFGNAVAVSGNIALVGAYQDNIGTNAGPGSVSVFSSQGQSSWQRTGIIDGSNFGDQFGWSVSLSGNTALVGARLADQRGTHSGSATIFRPSTSGNWTFIATLIGHDTVAGDQFGIRVASTSGAVVVSSQVNAGTGAAYVFRDDRQGNWNEEAKLIASDAVMRDTFGASVSISGDTVLVGAPGRDDFGNNSGAAYIFRRDGAGNWREAAKLIASDAEEGRGFGGSVSLYGNTAIVGTTDLIHYDSPGSAYVFRDDGTGTWNQIAQLTIDHVKSNMSVAIGDRVAILGNPGHDDIGSGGGTDPGAAYVFYEDNVGSWNLTHMLTASDAAAGDGFGRSVAVSGSTFIVGAQFNDDKDAASGSAYLFVVPEPSSYVLLCGLCAGGIILRRNVKRSVYGNRRSTWR